MKKSNLYLSILSALIISACGSSSSNDNQSVDPTPTPTPTPSQNQNTNTNPPKPKSPAANPNPESVTQNQSTNQIQNNQPINSKKAPAIKSKPTTHKHNGQGGNGQGNTTNAGNDKKLPPVEKVDTTKTAEAAEKDHLAAVERKAKADVQVTEANKVANEAQAKANKTKGKLIGAVNAVDLAAQDLNSKKSANPPKPAEIAEAQVKLDAAKDALKTAQEEHRAALENQTKTYIDRVVAQRQAKIEEENIKITAAVAAAVKAKESEPQAVVDALEAAANSAEAEAAQQVAEAEKTIAAAEAKYIDNEIKALDDSIKENKKIVESSNVSPEDKVVAQEAIDADSKKKEELEKSKKEAEDKENDAKVKLATAKEEAKIAKKKATDANNDTKYRGVYGSDGAYSSTSFQNVSKAENSNSKWTLTLKDGGEIKFDTATGFTVLQDAAPKVYGRFSQVDGKDVVVSPATFNKGIYGVYDGKFFSAGEVADPMDGTNYAGTAILKTTQGNVDLVAEVTATVAGKDFAGDFDNFRSYAISGGTGVVGASAYKGNGFNGNVTDKVSFKAKIDGQKFVPVDNPAANDAKVYGYFYKEKQAGGLVEHKKFNGAFGVKNP